MSPARFAETLVSGGGGPNPSDSFSIGIKAVDTNVAPTDLSTFLLRLGLSDSNAAPTETAKLGLTFADSNAAPTDSRSIVLRVWLSGSAGGGVTNPTNANADNNGTLATISTAAAGTPTETLISALGANVGTITFTACTYRGWFSSQTVLATSKCEVILHSTTAAFLDTVIHTYQPTAGGTVSFLGGSFTNDLMVTLAPLTLAKLQSLQIYHRTTDAAAGVTPAVMQVDAGALDITGVF